MEWRSCRQQVALLMNEDFDPCVISHINYIILYVNQHREVYSTQKAKHKTVANMQDTGWSIYGVMTMYYHTNQPAR